MCERVFMSACALCFGAEVIVDDRLCSVTYVSFPYARMLVCASVSVLVCECWCMCALACSWLVARVCVCACACACACVCPCAIVFLTTSPHTACRLCAGGRSLSRLRLSSALSRRLYVLPFAAHPLSFLLLSISFFLVLNISYNKFCLLTPHVPLCIPLLPLLLFSFFFRSLQATS